MLPRRVLPHQVHMITRRCSERRFFLKPTKATKAIVLYALGVALKATSVEFYGHVVEANHYHAVVGDPKGELSAFMQRFDQLIGRALNAYYGRGESLWCPGSFSNVEIHDEETLIRELVYVYSNPVKDGLVARPELWPGLKTAPEDMGNLTLTAKKPETAFFGGKRPKNWIARGTLTPAEVREVEAEQRQEAARARAEGERVRAPRSKLPDEVRIEVKLPALAEDRETFVSRVRAALEREVEEIHAKRKAEGKPPFMGAAAIRALDPFASAGSTYPKFKLNPRIASGNQDGERQQLLRELKAWRAAYKAALEEWRNGRRDVVFPPGTNRMAKLHNCVVGEVPLLL